MIWMTDTIFSLSILQEDLFLLDMDEAGS